MSRWHYAKSVPDQVYVACSGGIDSVAVAHILSQWKDVTLCHFGHADHASDQERHVVENLAKDLGIPLIISNSSLAYPSSNREASWREDRYKWFTSLPGPVATGHTLDDAVEWYLMTCLRGRGEYMPYCHGNVIRPFLLTRKSELVDHVRKNNLVWWEDPTNNDPDFGVRARVRNKILPEALICQPGLYNTVKTRLQEKIRNE